MFHDMLHAVTACVWAGAFVAFGWMRHQRKMAEIGRAAPDPFDAPTNAHQREVAQLRDRVRVLERIATDQARHDSSHTLAAQIDALKD